MLSVFPQLLFLTPLSPTLLRVSVGILFLYIIMRQWKRFDSIAAVDYPLVGRGAWIVWVGIIYEAIVALMLITGFYMQIAAILGIIATIKFLIFKKNYPDSIPLSRVSSALLLVILVSLLVTGAGLFAFDLPL